MKEYLFSHALSQMIHIHCTHTQEPCLPGSHGFTPICGCVREKLKGTPSELARWSENIENVWTIFIYRLCKVVLLMLMQHKYSFFVVFALNLNFSGCNHVGLPFYQWRAEKDWLISYRHLCQISGVVHDIKDVYFQTQSGSVHGHVCVTFKHRFFFFNKLDH